MAVRPSFKLVLPLFFLQCGLAQKWSFFRLESPLYDLRGLHSVTPHFHFKDYHSYHYHIGNLDLDLILASRRLVHTYVGCLIDIGPCNSEGDELKRILPDAIATKCAKCSSRQKDGARKVINALQSRYPYEWKLLLEKWDLQQLKDAL